MIPFGRTLRGALGIVAGSLIAGLLGTPLAVVVDAIVFGLLGYYLGCSQPRSPLASHRRHEQ